MRAVFTDRFRSGIFLKTNICLMRLTKTKNILHPIMLPKWWLTLVCHHFTFSSEVKKDAIYLTRMVGICLPKHG